MKKKKILFLNPYVYPYLVKDQSYDAWESYFGGGQIAITSIIKGFEEKKKYRLIIFVWNEFIDGFTKKLGGLEFVSGFYHKWLKKGGIYNFFFLLHSILLLIIVNPNYIVKSGYEGKWEIVISLYSMIFRKKYLIMVLTSTELMTNNNLLNKSILRFLGLTGVDFVCQNKMQMKQVEENVKGKKCRMIKNVLLLSKTGKNEPKQRNYVLWVGRNDDLKNPLAFIRLCKNIDPGINKIMICSFNKGNFIDQDKIEYESRNINNFTLIKGLVIDSQVYFKYARVHVNTSSREGFPNTFVQSFYEGVPIVSLHFNVDNFINTEKCGLFANSSEGTLQNHVELLCNNEEKWQYHSEKAKEYYKREFDFNSNINLLEECLT